MTVKLLIDWPDSRTGKNYVAGNLLTTDAATEAGMVAAKIASSDLTGGSAYIAPAVQKQYVPVTATSDPLTGGLTLSSAGKIVGIGERVINATYTTRDINDIALELNAKGGGVIRLLPGDYTLTETGAVNCIELPGNIHLTGCGRSTRVKVGSSVPPNTHAIGTLDNAQYVEVSNFVLHGNRARLSSTYYGEDDGIGGANALFPYIHDMYIYEIGDCAIDFDQVIQARIERNNIWDCNGNAVHLSGASGALGGQVYRNRIKNCAHERQSAGLANAAAVDIVGAHGNVSLNWIEDCYRGVFISVVSGVSRSIVSKNTIISPLATMYQGVSGDANTLVDGNVITGATSSGVHASKIVINNIIDGGFTNVNCTSSGVRVIGNVLSGSSSQCVQINSAAITYGRIADNEMTRNGTKINCLAGSGVVIDNNDYIGTGTAVSGAAAASMIVRDNP